jgi:predicted Zn-dependent protease
MPKIPPALLEPFSGYLDLGMYAEANDELEKLPNEIKTHPTILVARLALLMEMERWEDGAILGDSLCKLWPKTNEFHVRTAFCLHELKRTNEARKVLLNGPQSLRKEVVFYYNLACYEAQLGNILEAKKQLATCFKMDKNYKAEALDDPDLETIWQSIQ